MPARPFALGPFSSWKVSASMQSSRGSAGAKMCVALATGSRKLTTPAFAVRTPVGAKIYFIPPTNRLSTSFKEDKAIERAKQKGASPTAQSYKHIRSQ
jgi:hypothetical protein